VHVRLTILYLLGLTVAKRLFVPLHTKLFFILSNRFIYFTSIYYIFYLLLTLEGDGEGCVYSLGMGLRVGWALDIHVYGLCWVLCECE
jgi:hypothetical protein